MKTFDFTTGASSSLALSQKYLTELFDQRKRVQIKEVKGKRTLDQNALYWMWLKIISDDTGNDVNDLHEFFKAEYLTQRHVFINISGCVKIRHRRTSTTELTTKEFLGYMENIETFCNTELQMNLPHPEDLGFNELYEKYGNY